MKNLDNVDVVDNMKMDGSSQGGIYLPEDGK